MHMLAGNEILGNVLFFHPYLEFFPSLFFPIQTTYGEIQSISQYLVRMWGNAGTENSKYVRLLPTESLLAIFSFDQKMNFDENSIEYFLIMFNFTFHLYLLDEVTTKHY